MKPTVSVRLMTYNHASFITQALESALAQQTSFPIEIVIGDDYSNDGTRSTLDAYQKKFPEKIRLLDRPINGTYWQKRQHGNHLTNFEDIVKNCQGKYIALLDGDDMWTDPGKLQQQVDFLDKNPDFVMSCHHVRYWNEEQGAFKFQDMSFSQPHNTYALDDLLKGNFITTCSVVFRNNYELPDWFTQLSVGDWPLYIILCGLSKGKIHCINQYLATYRIHTGGVFSLQTKISQIKRLIDACGILLERNSFLDSRQQYLLRKLEAAYHLQLLSTIHTKTIDRKTRLKWFCETMKRIKYFKPTELRYTWVFFFDVLFNRK